MTFYKMAHSAPHCYYKNSYLNNVDILKSPIFHKSSTEQEIHDVAVLDNIILALGAHLVFIFGAVLEIGLNDACRLRTGVAHMDKSQKALNT